MSQQYVNVIDLFCVDLDLLVVEGAQFVLILEDLLVRICLLFLQVHILLQLLCLLTNHLLLNTLQLLILLS